MQQDVDQWEEHLADPISALLIVVTLMQQLLTSLLLASLEISEG